MIYENQENLHLVASLLFLFTDIVGAIYLLIKAFRVLCFAKITFDQIPVFNPYKWPLSMIRVVTRPYFRFWLRLFPHLRIGKVSYEVSAIIGLEALSVLLVLCLHSRGILLSQIESLLS